MGTWPLLPSFCQQGLRAVMPFIPQTRLLVLQTAAIGAFDGQPSGCDRADHSAVVLPLVWAMKFVHTAWLSESGRKCSKTGMIAVRLELAEASLGFGSVCFAAEGAASPGNGAAGGCAAGGLVGN